MALRLSHTALLGVLAAAPAAALDPRRYPASTSSALDATVEPHMVSPLPAETLAPSDLPATWDWRNVSTGLTDTSGGAFFQNLVTIPRNQHIPQCAPRSACLPVRAATVLPSLAGPRSHLRSAVPRTQTAAAAGPTP